MEKQEQLQDLRVFENELRNHIYDFINLRYNMRSLSIYLTISDLREISQKAAKAARRNLERITKKAQQTTHSHTHENTGEHDMSNPTEFADFELGDVFEATYHGEAVLAMKAGIHTAVLLDGEHVDHTERAVEADKLSGIGFISSRKNVCQFILGY